MKHVGIPEATTTLSTLIEEVEKGGSIVITRGGRPVAKLVPAQPELSEEEILRRREALQALRKTANELRINASPQEIKEWINEGRH